MFINLFNFIRNVLMLNKLKNHIKNTNKKTLFIQLIGLIIFLFTSGIVWNSWGIVNPGQRGVYVVLGKSEQRALLEGFHWKQPFISSIVKINVRQVVFDQQAEASSKDLQTVYTGIAVNYFPVPQNVWKLFLEIGESNSMWENVLLRPAIQEVTKAVTAKYTAEELITRREEAKQQITKEIISRLIKVNINVSEVSITDFKFNKAFNDAIEAKQIAEQRAKQAQNELQQVEIDSKQLVVKSNAEKEATIQIAEGKAREIELLTQAESRFHKTLSRVVTPSTLQLRYIERWNGIMPTVTTGSGGMELTLPGSLVEPPSKKSK